MSQIGYMHISALPSLQSICIYPVNGAMWRSGYAPVCKTVYSGSIPDVASIILYLSFCAQLRRNTHKFDA